MNPFPVHSRLVGARRHSCSDAMIAVASSLNVIFKEITFQTCSSCLPVCSFQAPPISKGEPPQLCWGLLRQHLLLPARPPPPGTQKTPFSSYVSVEVECIPRVGDSRWLYCGEARQQQYPLCRLSVGQLILGLAF